MNFFSVMHDPGEISRRQTRIEKAMKSWRPFQRHALQNFLDAHNPFAIDIETQSAADPRGRSICAYQISGLHPTRRRWTIQAYDYFVLKLCMTCITSPRHPFRASANSPVQKSLIEK